MDERLTLKDWLEFFAELAIYCACGTGIFMAIGLAFALFG